jgi:hypothetical protein
MLQFQTEDSWATGDPSYFNGPHQHPTSERFNMIRSGPSSSRPIPQPLPPTPLFHWGNPRPTSKEVDRTIAAVTRWNERYDKDRIRKQGYEDDLHSIKDLVLFMHRNPFCDIRHAVDNNASVDIIVFIGFNWMSCVPKILNIELVRTDITTADPALMAMLYRIGERVFNADVTHPDDDFPITCNSYNTYAPGMPYYHTGCSGNYTSRMTSLDNFFTAMRFIDEVCKEDNIKDIVSFQDITSSIYLRQQVRWITHPIP